MTQEEKQLLSQDLCARLPYRTMVKCITDYHREFDEELSVRHIMNFYQFEVKPYLRPMSSMTEEENVIQKSKMRHEGYFVNPLYFHTIEEFDYLNSIHVDYRGLISEGLALEAPKEMYK